MHHEESATRPVHPGESGTSLKSISQHLETKSLTFVVVNAQQGEPIPSLSTNTASPTTPRPLSWGMIDEIEAFVISKLCVETFSIVICVVVMVLLYRIRKGGKNRDEYDYSPRINDFVVILTSTAVSVHCIFYFLSNLVCVAKTDNCGSSKHLIGLEQGD